MGKSDSINCERCGKSIKIEQGMDEGFCLYCGERFVIEQAGQIADKISKADKFFEEREWPQLWQIVKNEKGAGKLGVYKIVSGFYVNYLKYVEESEELEKKTRSKAFFEAFIGRNSYASDEIHNEFRAFAENCVHELVEDQKEKDVAESAGPEACALITEFLLSKKNMNSVIYWPLTACEHLCIPLIPFIPLERLVAIHKEYEKINPPSQTLPNQKNVKTAIAVELANKGVEMPKKKRFGKK